MFQPESRRHQRQGEGMVDKLDERVVKADEGEAVQFAAVRTLAMPHRVDDRTQRRKPRTVERPFDNDVALAVELVQHPR